jgi:hypothetical protein
LVGVVGYTQRHRFEALNPEGRQGLRTARSRRQRIAPTTSTFETARDWSDGAQREAQTGFGRHQ